MCIIAIAWQIFDDMPLLLLSNRDEFLHRPTLSAYQWQDMPIFAGRDKQSGGTWLGYHTGGKQKRWATVLNFREKNPKTEKVISRGKLVSDFLASPEPISPMQYARQINLSDYAGFNLIIGDEKQAVLVNNRGYPPTALHAGLHVISNGQPTEQWFKCERLRTRISQELLPLITQGVTKKQWQKVALTILSDTLQASDDNLPISTGKPYALEKALSSIFIEHGRLLNYGTRTQSILTLQGDKFELLSHE